MNLDGKTIVVTGATSGLGQAAAVSFGQQGARVFVVGRDAARAEETRAQAGPTARVVIGDVSTRAGVAAVADAVLAETDRVDVLLNNAGGQFGKREATEDGVERTFALNVLGYHLLERALHGALTTARGRVVNVATGFLDSFRIDPDELRDPSSYSAMRRYAQCKNAAVVLTVDQARRYGGDVRAVAVHPGIIMGTRFGGGQPALVQRIFGPVMRGIGLACTLEEAVRRYGVACFDDVPTGSYLVDGKVATLPKDAQDEAIRAKVMTGIERAAAVEGTAA